MKTLMLLAQQPIQRPLFCLPRAVHLPCIALGFMHGQKPPKRGVDTAQIPEISSSAIRIHIFRNLPIGCLLPGQRIQTGQGPVVQQLITTDQHAERTDGGISAKDTGISTRFGLRGGAGSKNSMSNQVLLQQAYRFMATLRDQLIALQVPWTIQNVMLLHANSLGWRTPKGDALWIRLARSEVRPGNQTRPRELECTACPQSTRR